MDRIEACLLDYGNTVVPFDEPQVSFVLRGFSELLAERYGAVELEELRAGVEEVCRRPFCAEEPSFREYDPREQMLLVLREVYPERRTFDPGEVATLDDRFQDLFVESIDPVPETVCLLERLGSRRRLGLVSNYPCGRALRRSLARVGIDRLLDPVVISGEVGFVKPHPEPFRVAREALGIAPERILFVGDRWDADMVGAWRAGMRTCHHVGWTSDRDQEERYQAYRPELTIERLEELETLLESGAARRA